METINAINGIALHYARLPQYLFGTTGKLHNFNVEETRGFSNVIIHQLKIDLISTKQNDHQFYEFTGKAAINLRVLQSIEVQLIKNRKSIIDKCKTLDRQYINETFII